ncbi:MAG: hypothetical protein Q8M40_02970 [Legionella sp.]|nr:hypothetical protein [Legionella sp.]
MFYIRRSIEGYKERINGTLFLAKSPWSLLKLLLTIEDDIYTIGFKLAGVFLSPVLIISGLVSYVLGAIATVIQTSLLPFQLIVSGLRDAGNYIKNVIFSKSSDKAEGISVPIEPKSTEVVQGDGKPEVKNSISKDSAPGHYPPVFEATSAPREIRFAPPKPDKESSYSYSV